MTQTSRLVLEVDSRSAEQRVNETRQALQKLEAEGLKTPGAMSAAAESIGKVGDNAKSTTPQLSVAERQFKMLSSAAVGLGGALAAAFSVQKIAQASQQYADLTNRLRLVTEGSAQLARAQDDVFRAAQNSRQSLEVTASVYQRIAQNGKALGISMAEVAKITETVTKSVAMSGASAASADAALVQFGQALASGTLRGEELNSILEQTPALAQTIARGLGVTIGQLRAMGAEGQLTAEKVIGALSGQKDAVDKLAATMQVTASQAMTAFANSLTSTIGKLDQATGASNTFANSVLSVSRALDGFNSGEFLDFFREDKQSVAGFNNDIAVTISRVRELTAARSKLNPGDAKDSVLFNFKFYNREEIDAEIAGLNKKVTDTRASIGLLKKGADDLGAQLPKGEAAIGGLSAAAKGYVDSQSKALAKLQDNNDAVKEANRFIAEHTKLTDAEKAAILSVAYATNAQTKANKDAAAATRDANKAYQENAGQKMLDNARQQYAVLVQQGALIDEQAVGAKTLGSEAKKLLELEQQIAQLKEKGSLTTAQKQILAMGELNIAQQKQNAALEKENELRKIANAEAAKLLTFTESINDKLALSQQGLSNQLAGIGLGQEGRKRLQDDLKIRQDYQKDMDKLQAQFNSGDLSKELYDKETGMLEDALSQRLSMQDDYYVALDRAQSDWMNGANAAFQDYSDESANIAGQTYDLVSNGLGELEDQFVSVFTTGKFSFKDLANSIIADLARMLAKAYVVMPILGALGLSGSSGGGGGVAGAWSSITGGEGGGGGITSMISSAKTVIDVASSKFGESLINGWNSGGESLVDSLSGAFDGGASYVSDAISSAFTAGSATATVAAEATAASFTAGISESAAAIGSQFSAEIGGAAISYEAASAASANALSSTLGTLSTALSVIGTAYTVFTAFQDYGVEGGLTTAGFAAAGAAIGSVVPVIGTAIGAAIGAVIGSIASASWFGGPNYEQLVSSAEGSYSDGKFKDEGWYDGWKENKTRLGAGTDGKLMSYVQQFTSTMGMLYDALGDGSDVSAAVTMRRRETSGDWSNGMAATLDNGVQITALKQYGLDVEENLTAYYDDFMGTFLAQAIVSSESLPQYFKNQFEAYSTDWEVSADTVIAAIEGVFTRFNGVNSALGQINVAGLKLNETGMIASDSILNMVASLADLDSESATAKEKVDALNELVNSYYSVFFTADEQFADLTSSLKGSFAGFGLALPDTREAYRAMVEDIDVTTSAGQAMFATMMGLATAADSYYSTVAKNQANYYDLFTSDGQKATDTLASVGAQFKELGLALPANREGFVAMVGSIDQTTEKGKALFASLLGLATNADAAFDIMEQQSAATAQAISESLLNGVTSAQSALQRAVSAQQKIVTAAYNDTTEKLNTSLTAANTNVNDLTSVSNDLSSALKSLRGDSDEAVKMLRAQAVATLQSALATARAGGSLSGFKGLDDALDTVSSNNTDLYSSMEDFARDQGRTAGVIAELEAINGKQLTSAEKTVKALEDQLKLAEDNYKLQMDRFDSQLEFAQAQVDAINGVDTSIMGVTAAVNAMNAAVVAALATVTGANPTNSGTLIDTAYQNTLGQSADSAGKDYWQGQLSNGAISYDQLAGAIKNAAAENAIKAAYQSILGKSADAAGSAYWAGQVSSGALTVSQLEQAIRNAAMANGSIPAFAMGGFHSGGIRLVGEKGPEIEATGAARYWSAKQSAAAMAGVSSGGSSTEMVERQSWTNRLLNQLIQAVKQQTQQGIPVFQVNK